MPKPSWDEVRAFLVEHAESDEGFDEIARLLAEVLPQFVQTPLYERYFSFWEERGVHLTPVHFYWPVPDTRTLDESIWKTPSEMPGVDMNDGGQLHLLNDVFPRYREEFEQLPDTPTGSAHDFYFQNPLFGGTDALVLYCMVRHLTPSRVVEVGSGFSSRLTARALRRNGHGELTCIEPYPDEVLQAGFPGLTEVIQKRVQDVDLSVFTSLEAKDILFIDSSHIVAIGSDVNYLFLEVLPRLQPGVIVHVHDIFLPLPGIRDWFIEQRRFWNEQYLLQAFLIFNSAYEVLLSNTYLAERHPEEMRRTFPHANWWGGGSFWMKRR